MLVRAWAARASIAIPAYTFSRRTCVAVHAPPHPAGMFLALNGALGPETLAQPPNAPRGPSADP